MRRSDRNQAIAKLPISVLPLGADNFCGRAIHKITGEPQAIDLLDATMAVIKHTVTPVSVVEVTQENTRDDDVIISNEAAVSNHFCIIF